MANDFGTVLQRLMKERNLSGRSLAKDLGVPQKTVNEWIGAGARIPRNPESIKRLANYFGVSVHYLLFGVEDSKGGLGEFLEKTEVHTGLYEITIKKVKGKKVGG